MEMALKHWTGATISRKYPPVSRQIDIDPRYGAGRSIPDVQQLLAVADGTMFFSQHRAFDPCAPGCT
jgi:hypothetical protein